VQQKQKAEKQKAEKQKAEELNVGKQKSD